MNGKRLDRAALFIAQLYRLSARARILGDEPKASAAMSALRVCPWNRRSTMPKRPGSSIAAPTTRAWSC